MNRDRAIDLTAPEGSATWWYIVGWRDAEIRSGQYAALTEILSSYAELLRNMEARRAQRDENKA